MAGDTMELRILGPDVGSADPAVTSRRPTLGPVDDDEPTPGWYAYLLPAAARPREL